MKPNQWIACGAVLAGLAVSLGAFGAHGLEDFLSKNLGVSGAALTQRLENHETAVRYQMYHAVALALVGLIGMQRQSRRLNAAGWCFIGGVTFFSGGLYAIVIGSPGHWAIVPLGGLALIAGWLLLAAAAWTARPPLDRKPAAGAKASLRTAA